MKRDDYVPETLQEAVLYFSDDEVCHEFMVSLRWPNNKVMCPHCESENVTFFTSTPKKVGAPIRRLWQCKNKECKKQFTVKTGTVFEDSPLSLKKWLPCVWLVTSAKNGISSYEVHRALGVTQKTAWFMLHRIRVSMGFETDEKMDGECEADETFIGGKARNMHKGKRKAKGRGTVGKSVVSGILQRHEKGSSEVRAKVVKDTTRKTLHKQVKDNVAPDSIVFTDALPSYGGLSPEFMHAAIDHAHAYVDLNVIHTNGLENFWSLFKRCIKGTYVSADPWHLQKYLDEEVFRFNARRLTDTDRFLLVTRNVIGKRLTYKALTGNDGNGQEEAA